MQDTNYCCVCVIFQYCGSLGRVVFTVMIIGNFQILDAENDLFHVNHAMTLRYRGNSQREVTHGWDEWE